MNWALSDNWWSNHSRLQLAQLSRGDRAQATSWQFTLSHRVPKKRLLGAKVECSSEICITSKKSLHSRIYVNGISAEVVLELCFITQFVVNSQPSETCTAILRRQCIDNRWVCWQPKISETICKKKSLGTSWLVDKYTYKNKAARS